MKHPMKTVQLRASKMSIESHEMIEKWEIVG
mgnify:FL=1